MGFISNARGGRASQLSRATLLHEDAAVGRGARAVVLGESRRSAGTEEDDSGGCEGVAAIPCELRIALRKEKSEFAFSVSRTFRSRCSAWLRAWARCDGAAERTAMWATSELLSGDSILARERSPASTRSLLALCLFRFHALSLTPPSSTLPLSPRSKWIQPVPIAWDNLQPNARISFSTQRHRSAFAYHARYTQLIL